MNTLETLKAARRLITPREKWTQGVFARDENGHVTRSEHSDAFCFCAVGALYKVAKGDYFAVDSAEAVLQKCIGNGRSVAEFNDARRRSHTDVLRLFDRAIAATAQGDAP